MGSQLTEADIQNFFRFLYFGKYTDVVSVSMDKAYLDFNRTLRGLDKYRKEHNNNDYVAEAKIVLAESIRELLDPETKIKSQQAFDDLHKETCDRLRQKFDEFPFQYGQAQKWINMTLKYIFILDPDSVSHVYSFFHTPIDNIMREHLRPYNPPTFSSAWSQIDNYEDYFHFQLWFRGFAGNPLDNEFLLFMDKDTVLTRQSIEPAANSDLR